MREPELLLVRHGRSAHVERGWIDVDGVRRWMTAYDAAEIAPGHAPSEELEALARDAAMLIASDLPRTVASAMRLAPDRPIVRTALLREAPLETPELPLPALGGIRLPLRGWGMVFGARWLVAWLRSAPPPGVDAKALARADEAAEWLVGQAADAGGRVVVVTHATFRLLLAQALARRGWRGPERRPYREWSAWRYLPPLLGAARDRRESRR
jgi:broad specificity phosphatase PhoE